MYSSVYVAYELGYLKEEFDLNIGEARGISQINNEEEYSEKIDEVCKATKK